MPHPPHFNAKRIFCTAITILLVCLLGRLCGFSLEEDPASRELGEKVQVVLVPAECSKPQAEHARTQTLTLVLRGMCTCIKNKNKNGGAKQIDRPRTRQIDK